MHDRDFGYREPDYGPEDVDEEGYEDEDPYAYETEEEQFNREYYGNLAEHTCNACGCRFKAPAMRGPLGYCDNCADKRERGEDLYE